MTKHLWHLANDWDVAIVRLIQLASRMGVSNVPTQQQVEALHRHVSGYAALTNEEIRSIDDFLQSKEAVSVLSAAVPALDHLDEDQQQRYLRQLSRQLHETMPPSDLKRKITPETIYETVMNLGVITVYRSKAVMRPERQVPMDLLVADPDIAHKTIKSQFLRTIARVPLEQMTDFDVAQERLEQDYKRMMTYVKDRP